MTDHQLFTAEARHVALGSSEHLRRDPVNHTGDMASPCAQLCGYKHDAAKALPRFDGRPAELAEARAIHRLGKGSLALRYWHGGTPFRDISLAAFRLSLATAEEANVAFCYQSSQGSTTLRRQLAAIDPSIHLVATSKVSRFDCGGAEELAALIREHHVSVVVVDNLSQLMPQLPWNSPASRFDEAERETLRELRRLTAAFNHAIEVVLFHLVNQGKAEQLLAERLVDRIEEVRP